ncbi:hypothetical protein RSPO_c03250 [Ralstonia solanacearum Po82]|uniref:Uncharacterized protein n=1 Tax=Ralstonia solanacearum (strain Po82) TaxID=1031711 RepID=F6G642_RALS8|nr:hypothetical protein RSPO_c03250 [Ralstonia solanacearum Po82]
MILPWTATHEQDSNTHDFDSIIRKSDFIKTKTSLTLTRSRKFMDNGLDGVIRFP